MWGFSINNCVKWKKQILDVQNGKIYAQADVIDLSPSKCFDDFEPVEYLWLARNNHTF